MTYDIYNITVSPKQTYESYLISLISLSGTTLAGTDQLEVAINTVEQNV